MNIIPSELEQVVVALQPQQKRRGMDRETNNEWKNYACEEIATLVLRIVFVVLQIGCPNEVLGGLYTVICQLNLAVRINVIKPDESCGIPAQDINTSYHTLASLFRVRKLHILHHISEISH
jgi:hypothetical protein